MQVSILEDRAVKENEYDLAQIKPKKDYNVILFFLNIAAVIIGYGLAAPTGFASLIPMKIARIILLGISLIYLFNSNKNYQYGFKGSSSWIMWVFIVLNIYVIPFSANIFTSFEKFINLIPYFIYLNYFMVYLNRKYDKQYNLDLIINFLNIVYLLPLFTFLIFGNLGKEDIYGEIIGGFVSNHYGWSAVTFLATGVDMLRNNSSISRTRKTATLLFCVLACYILIVSGSRSGYLAFLLCFLLFVLRNKNVKLFLKLASVIGVTFIVIQLYGDEDSALNKRIKKTETQLEKGDSRNKAYQLGFETMADYPITLITGFGFYAFKEGVTSLNKNVTNQQIRISLHNSYYELLFGSGLFIFALFAIFFVAKTIIYFFIYHSARYLFLPPILLIPFFENDFNPGQFLFFPWFAIMFYYIHFGENQVKLSTDPYEE